MSGFIFLKIHNRDPGKKILVPELHKEHASNILYVFAYYVYSVFFCSLARNAVERTYMFSTSKDKRFSDVSYCTYCKLLTNDLC